MFSPQQAIGAMEEADREILALLGIEVNERAADRAVLAMTVRMDMVNSQGFCHGGFVYTLADTAFAYAAGSDGVGPITASAEIIYLRGARLGDTLRAEAVVITRSRRSGTADAEVFNQAGDRVARFRGVFSRSPG